MKKLIIYITIFFSCSVFSQGLNNDYLIDSVDIKNSLKLLGMEIFKFPLKTTNKAYFVNYIVEEIKDGVKTEKINYIDLYKSQDIPKEILKRLIIKIDKEKKWFRVYFLDKEEDITTLQIQADGFPTSTFNFVLNGKFKYDYRAFDFSQPKIGKRTPIVVRYAKKNVNKIEHCPGNISVDEISKLYEHLIVIYIELVEL